MKETGRMITLPEGQLSICQAECSDIDLLMSFRMEVFHHVFSVPEGKPGEALYEANRAYYLAALTDHTHIACFAMLNGEAVGCGGICIQEEMPSPDNASGRNAYLMNIYTRESFRGRGIGRHTVEWLIEKARETGAEKIFLETSEAGRRLYEEIGFKPMKDYLKL